MAVVRAFLLLSSIAVCSCFTTSGSLLRLNGKPFPSIASSGSVTSLRMGIFDQIGKALAESFANDESLGKQTNPGFRDGYDGPKAVTVRFSPGGQVASSYGGERLGDVARRAGVQINYGCQKGTCGTCEVTTTWKGYASKVRVCEAIVPKHEDDNTPELVVQLQDSKIALKRKFDWEQIKNK